MAVVDGRVRGMVKVSIGPTTEPASIPVSFDGWTHCLADHTFYFRGQRHRVNPDGAQVIQLLRTAAKTLEGSPASVRLLSYCGDFYWIIHRQPMPLLGYVVERTNSASIRRLAIWLLGRCRSTIATESVAARANDPDPKMRREVVRALQRMHGWSELRKIVETEQDPVIRRMAMPRSPKSYGVRLQEFMGNVAARAVPTSRQPLIITEHCDLAAGRPAKPRWVIRYLLERIQYWVRRYRA
jgi:hypothetical protein